ncbi:AAA family ATPase [Halobacillus sp. A5]|uniref:ATP-binding protein n=1 Tax=Halobacillus sp. A5 TaxID=2880263 RepID=UPI0020A64580|nr:AAA family ATPase [Halobacillus sp. A5]MCP3026762.1 AAA family ATPase [Halobacillus sp. A5]
MKLTSLYIYGFGKWKDYSLSLSSHSLTVISGANEAGKSTLQQFILFILFGMPPQKRSFYQPKTGGTVGGRIIVQTDSYGEIIVERVDDRHQGEAICRLPSGETRGEDFLKKLMGGLHKSVYQSIYGFNANDLQELTQLNGEELGEVLLNVGLTGSSQIHQAEKNLDKQLNEKFKPKGRNPELNRMLTRIDELAARKSRIEKEIGDYQLSVERLEKLDEEIAAVDEAREAQRRAYYSHMQIKKALPIIQNYHQLTIHEAERPVPKAARHHMGDLQEQLLPLQSEVKSLQDSQSAKEIRLKNINSEVHAYDRKDLSIFEAQESEYQQAEQEYKRLTLQIDKYNDEIDKEMNRLDLSVDKTELQDYEFPFYLEETWRALREEEQLLEQQEIKAAQESEALRRQMEHTQGQLQSLLTGSISEKQSVEHSELIDRYIHSQPSHEGKSNTKKTLMMAALITAGSLFLALETNQIIPLLIGVLTAAGVIVINRTGSPGQRAPSITKEMYMKAREELQQYDQAKGEIIYLREQQQEQNDKCDQLKKWNDEWAGRKSSLQLKIKEQVKRYPFLVDLKLVHWEKLYHLLKQVKDRHQELMKLKAERQVSADHMRTIEEQAARFFKEQNWEHNERTVSRQLQLRKEFVKDQLQLNEESIQLKNEIEQLQLQQERLETKIKPLENKKQTLFNNAGALSITDFYEKLDHFDQLQQQLETKNQLEHQVNMMLTSQEQETFQVWVTPPTESDIAFNLEKIEAELDKLQQDTKQYEQERAKTEHQIKYLESSDELSELTHQLALEKESFHEAAKEWASSKIALEVLSKTKEKYQNQHLPNVLKEAQTYFHKITHGKYTRLHLDGVQQEIVVQDEQGFYFKTEELSRGTADQLYVSLRLALAKTLAEELSMPFLVDDAFVNFDSSRLSTMLSIIEQISRQHQVILFTWREDLLELLDGESINTFQLSNV